MDGIKDSFAMFHRPHSKDSKGCGRRCLENQNAYDAVMTTINSNNLTSTKLGRTITCTLGVSHRQIKRGGAFQKNMEDTDKTR